MNEDLYSDAVRIVRNRGYGRVLVSSHWLEKPLQISGFEADKLLQRMEQENIIESTHPRGYFCRLVDREEPEAIYLGRGKGFAPIEEDLYIDAVRLVRSKRWISYKALSRLLEVSEEMAQAVFRRMEKDKIVETGVYTCTCKLPTEDPELVYLGPPRSLGFAVMLEELYWDAVRTVSTAARVLWTPERLFLRFGSKISKQMAEALLLRMEREDIVVSRSTDGYECMTSTVGQENRVTQEEGELRSELSALRVTYPELPALPSTTIGYEGWFQEALARFRLRSKFHTIEEQNKILALVRLLHEEFKQISAIRFDINRMKGEDQIKQLQIHKQITELQGQILTAKRELSAAVKQHAPSEIEKVREKTELIKARAEAAEAEARLEQANANLEKIKNSQSQSTPQPPAPGENDAATKILREFLKQQLGKEENRRKTDEIYEKLISLAESLGQSFGDPERRTRDAKRCLRLRACADRLRRQAMELNSQRLIPIPIPGSAGLIHVLTVSPAALKWGLYLSASTPISVRFISRPRSARIRTRM